MRQSAQNMLRSNINRLFDQGWGEKPLMNATSASWQFQVLNFPVRVHISFFLFTLLLGLSLGNVVLIALWIVIVFFSVLLHELGHAVVADYYGLSPHIELYSMGGLTIPSRYSVLSYPKEILLSFAGPLAGFIMGGILFAILRFGPPITNYYLNFILGEMIWVNIGWGIINLIPMLPLDGGNVLQVSRADLLRFRVGLGVVIAVGEAQAPGGGERDHLVGILKIL
jgi:Zn-dependent protease